MLLLSRDYGDCKNLRFRELRSRAHILFEMKLVLRCFSLSTLKMTSIVGYNGPIGAKICEKLSSNLSPIHLQLLNESNMHNVPKNSETHFKVIVVSEKFEGKPLIQRHRLVNDLLAEELKSGVHALSIVAKSPEQWEASTKEVEASPNCRGGFGK